LKLFTSPHNPFQYREKNKEGRTNDIVGNERMRSLIVDLARPGFINSFDLNDFEKKYVDETYRGCERRTLISELHTLNIGQIEVVKKVLSSKDYVLLLGMPGTG
jgi:hypothetical protein